MMFLPLTTGLALTFVIEQLHPPRPKPPWRRRPSDVLKHTSLWIFIFIVEFIQFRRPWLAMCLSCVIFYVLVLINYTKFRSLREPFIAQDFDYFLDAIKHPRLYLPFFGLWKIALCLMAVGLALLGGILLEAPITQVYPAEQVWLACLLLVLLALCLLVVAPSRTAHSRFNVLADFRQLGLLVLIWQYAIAERNAIAPKLLAKHTTLPNGSPTIEQANLPNTVVVQSESFFDPRKIFDNIKVTLLSGFDSACQNSVSFGPLIVPAWGANTVRTEFAFLTGIDPDMMGIDQFNPYRRAVHNEMPSIASEFKKRGYRTICIHPYPATFYQRNTIFPLLGFDRFIDIKSFHPLDAKSKYSPYITDQALTDKVLEVLDQPSDQPLFIFVITMENHGPLHLEPITEEEKNKWITGTLPTGCQELSIYLRHLANADQMVTRLIERLSVGSDLDERAADASTINDSSLCERSRPGQLLWYGDHVPVLTHTYEKLGMPKGHTDYFHFKSEYVKKTNHSERDERKKNPQIRGIHQLAAELLKQ